MATAARIPWTARVRTALSIVADEPAPKLPGPPVRELDEEPEPEPGHPVQAEPETEAPPEGLPQPGYEKPPDWGPGVVVAAARANIVASVPAC
jgi:hypothetical protein